GERERERVRGRAPERGAAESAHVIRESEAEAEEFALTRSRGLETGPDDHHERDDHLIGEEQNQQRKDDLLPAEARAALGLWHWNRRARGQIGQVKRSC